MRHPRAPHSAEGSGRSAMWCATDDRRIRNRLESRRTHTAREGAASRQAARSETRSARRVCGCRKLAEFIYEVSEVFRDVVRVFAVHLARHVERCFAVLPMRSHRCISAVGGGKATMIQAAARAGKRRACVGSQAAPSEQRLTILASPPPHLTRRPDVQPRSYKRRADALEVDALAQVKRQVVEGRAAVVRGERGVRSERQQQLNHRLWIPVTCPVRPRARMQIVLQHCAPGLPGWRGIDLSEHVSKKQTGGSHCRLSSEAQCVTGSSSPCFDARYSRRSPPRPTGASPARNSAQHLRRPAPEGQPGGGGPCSHRAPAAGGGRRRRRRRVGRSPSDAGTRPAPLSLSATVRLRC